MIKFRILKLAHGILEERHLASVGATSADTADRRKEAYLQKARMRCRELRELRYCPDCHLAFQTIHSFCDRCPNATEPLPSGYALEYAREEFPDLVATREDFDRLLG